MLLNSARFYVEDFFKFCGLLRISELYKGEKADWTNSTALTPKTDAFPINYLGVEVSE